jgi:membrane protease YdiL (CAAX protease family)
LVHTGLRRIGNYTAGALLLFEMFGTVLMLIPGVIVGLRVFSGAEAEESTAEMFVITFAINGLAALIGQYLFMSSFMKTLGVRDEVGKAYEKPKNVWLLIAALPLGFGLCMLSDQLTSVVMWLSENILHFSLTSPDLAPQVYDAPTIAILVLQIAISPALLEEFAFRGVMMQSLRRYGDKFAIVATALVFALFHGNVVQMLFAFPVGLVLGYFAVSTGSIWTSVLIHFANNLNSVLLLTYSANAGEAAYQSIATIELIASLVLGVLALVIYAVLPGKQKLAPRPEWVPKKGRMGSFLGSPAMVVLIILMIFSTISSLFVPKLLEWANLNFWNG